MADLQLPAYITNRTRPLLTQQALANVGSPRPPHISIAENRFALVDSTGNRIPIQTLYLDVCIFGMNPVKSKLFYDPDEPWTPDSTNPPLCWSDNGVGPSFQVSPPADFETGPTCELCPQNRWNSKISKLTGEGIKACRDEQKLAVLVPGFPGAFCLVVTPNSLKRWASYVARFDGQNFDFTDLVTRITFASGVNGTLEFEPSPQPYLDSYKGLLEARDAALANRVLDKLVGIGDRPRTAALPSPAPVSTPLPTPSNVLPTSQPAQTPQQQALPGFAPGASSPASAGVAPTPRRRRTRAQIEADNAAAAKAAPAQPAGPALAPFRPQPEGNGANEPGTNFGIGAGQPPNPEITNAINQLLQR